jgi:hypothetical protein
MITAVPILSLKKKIFKGEVISTQKEVTDTHFSTWASRVTAPLRFFVFSTRQSRHKISESTPGLYFEFDISTMLDAL